MTLKHKIIFVVGFLTHTYDAQSASDDDDVQELTASSDFTQRRIINSKVVNSLFGSHCLPFTSYIVTESKNLVVWDTGKSVELQ